MRYRLIIFIVASLTFLVSASAQTVYYGTSGDADLIAKETEDYSELGSAVEMGDLNNDGIDDIIVGEPGYQEGFAESRFGRILVYWGGDDDTVDLVIKTAANQNSQYSWNLGQALAVGDVNGDGVDDLIFSAPYAMSPNPSLFTCRGIVFVVYGKSNWTEDEIVLNPYSKAGKAGGPLADLQIYNDTADSMIYEESYSFGAKLASGDLNNDGYDDIIAAGEFSLDFGYKAYRRVFVIFGGEYDPKEVLSLKDDHALMFVGADSGSTYYTDALGSGLAAGDVTGDNIDDLLIGAPGEYRPERQKDSPFDGIVYEFDGRANWGSPPVKFDLDANPDLADLRVYGHSDSYEGLGQRVAVGDVNGDGIGDLIMAAPQYVFPGKGEKEPERGDGIVYFLWGSSDFADHEEIDLDDTGVPDVTIYGENIDDPDPVIKTFHFGHNMDTGDVNGDCIDDVLISVEYDNDETEVARMAYLVLGSDGFPAGHEMNMPDDAQYVLTNDDGGDNIWKYVAYGYCVDVALGDGNGDLVDDMLAGMEYWHNGDAHNLQGRAWLFHTPANLPPTADAGEDQEAKTGDEVTLEGSGEDPEGFAISYAWTQVSGPDVSLADPGTTAPSFTPEEAGEYVFQLVVSDCIQDGDPDEVTVTVTGEAGDDDEENAKDDEVGLYGSGGCGCL